MMPRVGSAIFSSKLRQLLMATMDERRLTSGTSDNWSQECARALDAGRQRTRDLLARQRDRLDSLESELTSQIQLIAEELAHDQSSNLEVSSELERKATALSGQAAALGKLKEDFQQRQAEYDAAQQQAASQHLARLEDLRAKQQQLEERQHSLEQAEAALRQTQRTLQTQHEEYAADKDQLAREQQRLKQHREQLEADRDHLTTEQTNTQEQRRRIAREFQAQRAAHLAELEERRSALRVAASQNQTQLEEQLATAHAEGEALREQMAQLRKLLNARASELTELRSQIVELTTECETLRLAHDQLSQELAIKQSSGDASSSEVHSLRSERDALAKRLDEAETKLASAQQGDGDARKKDDLQRRFEMAVDDVRELKRQNSDLEAKLKARGNSGGSTSTPDTGGKLDWEAQKQRLLASLEADFDENDEDDSEAKLTIEGTIRITDEIVAQKDREIEELKQLLDSQSHSYGEVAVGASAIAQLLDEDELIQHEREKLRQLEAEMQQKLREAEVGISLERAKIARERSELDEKLQRLQEQQLTSAEGDLAKGPGKPARGRWLTRLGLKDLEE